MTASLPNSLEESHGDHLGASADNNAFLNELFLQRLPANIHMVLTTDLTKLAEMADQVITSQQTCFDYVISSLSPEFAMEVRDLLFQPPARVEV